LRARQPAHSTQRLDQALGLIATRRCLEMTKRSTSADFVTAFATGWPENQPDMMVLSLTTHKGIQDFAFNKEQALLIAKTIKETADRLARPKQ
jgi:hypothetical protein